jgi:ERCC4-type nuclease
MRTRSYELQLPLDDGTASALARDRLAHLRAVNGVDGDVLVRLARAFHSLGEIYAAPEQELARVIGAVVAARIRWFLDAPLDTRLASAAETPPSLVIRHAA